MNVATVLDVLAANWHIAIGLFALGLLLYWTFDERGETESAAETIERVGERAEVVTEGVVGSFGSLLLVVASIGVTIGAQLLDLVAALNGLLGHAPVVVGHFLFGLIAFAGLEGYLFVTVNQLGMAFILITVVALIARYGDRVGGAASDD